MAYIPLPKVDSATMRYYDLKRNWTKRIQPHLDDEELNNILVRDFNKYTMERWNKPFVKGMYPAQFESCDWWLDHRGPEPRFWQYVKHAACHWLTNFNVRLACLAEPAKAWRIVYSRDHSTVWDGERTLFELNFVAFGVAAAECWELASRNGRQLRPGKLRRVGVPAPWPEMKQAA